MTYRPLAYAIEDVVTAVRDSYSPEQIVPYYDFGVALEVVNRLKLKSNTVEFRKAKYPLIWYLIDGSVQENVDYRKTNPREVQNVTIIICKETKVDFSARERYENNIIPTLRPLYDLFIHHLGKSKELKSDNKLNHGYSENLFWGREGLYGHEGNIFDDRLDAIIIDNLNLRVIESC